MRIQETLLLQRSIRSVGGTVLGLETGEGMVTLEFDFYYYRKVFRDPMSMSRARDSSDLGGPGMGTGKE